MALLALNIQERAAVSSAREPGPIPLRVGFDNLGRGATPGRGLLYSLLMHEAILAAVLWAPLYFDFGTHQMPLQTLDAEELSEARHVIYLPRLGGGSEANGRAGGGSVIRRNGSSEAPARASEGFTYPGRQTIISDPPQPTNRIQTILQPGIKHPATLKPLIPLPNIVQTANAVPLPDLSEPTKLVAPVPAELKPKTPTAKAIAESVAPVITATATPLDPSKLSVPAGPARPAIPTSLNAPKPRDKAVNDAGEAVPSQYSPVPTRGTDLQNLLVLSPTPAPPEQSAGVPAGESRGRFAISPEASAPPSPAGPGSKGAGSQASGVGLGGQTEASLGNSASDGEVGVANGAARLAVGGGGGTGLGTGKTSGSGNGGTGTDAGKGSGSGAGVGSGPGTSSGSGAGAGGGSGGGAFAGMTIQGGSLQGGEASVSPRVQFPTGPRPAYGMTVVSTANSGGGLGDFGVFAHEQVYTVYLDMRNTTEDRAPSWTLQCAILPADPAKPEEQRPAAHGSDQGFVPPFPVVKERPQLPSDVVTRYLSRMVIIYGVIETDGKLSQLSVRQSPDVQLNKPTLEALAKWTFRPAEENGSPVRVKVLLGIPLALAE